MNDYFYIYDIYSIYFLAKKLKAVIILEAIETNIYSKFENNQDCEDGDWRNWLQQKFHAPSKINCVINHEIYY